MFTFPAAHFGSSRIITVLIESSENDVNIFDKASAVGDPSRDIVDGEVYVILSDGVVIGSTSTSTAAMVSGSGWGSGWTPYVITEGTDSARIQGKGGMGGRGLHSSAANCGGGGGGGAGTEPGAGGFADTFAGAEVGDPGTSEAGGDGGSGGATSASDLGATAGAAGGPALEATDGGPDIHLAPEASATLEVWSGAGAGGGGGIGSSGGDGGDPGEGGTAGSGTAAAAGGAAGAAYSEPGSASIIEDGPGTIDKKGA